MKINMGKPTAVDSLRESILLLEIRQAEEGKILKEQLLVTYESLKPVNLFKSAIREISGYSEVKKGFLDTVIPVLFAFLTRKMFVRPRSNLFRRILGTVLQFGVTSFVAKNADSIRDFINQQFDRAKQVMAEKIYSSGEGERDPAAG